MNSIPIFFCIFDILLSAAFYCSLFEKNLNMCLKQILLDEHLHKGNYFSGYIDF